MLKVPVQAQCIVAAGHAPEVPPRLPCPVFVLNVLFFTFPPFRCFFVATLRPLFAPLHLESARHAPNITNLHQAALLPYSSAAAALQRFLETLQQPSPEQLQHCSDPRNPAAALPQHLQHCGSPETLQQS